MRARYLAAVGVGALTLAACGSGNDGTVFIPITNCTSAFSAPPPVVRVAPPVARTPSPASRSVTPAEEEPVPSGGVRAQTPPASRTFARNGQHCTTFFVPFHHDTPTTKGKK